MQQRLEPALMQAIGAQAKKAATTSRQAQQQLSTAMSFLQMLQQQMQAMQAQYTGGGGGKWNLGAAYRPPDTNINLSASYQQGRTNLVKSRKCRGNVEENSRKVPTSCILIPATYFLPCLYRCPWYRMKAPTSSVRTASRR